MLFDILSSKYRVSEQIFKDLMTDVLDRAVNAFCALGKVVVKEFLFAHNQG